MPLFPFPLFLSAHLLFEHFFKNSNVTRLTRTEPLSSRGKEDLTQQNGLKGDTGSSVISLWKNSRWIFLWVSPPKFWQICVFQTELLSHMLKGLNVINERFLGKPGPQIFPHYLTWSSNFLRHSCETSFWKSILPGYPTALEGYTLHKHPCPLFPRSISQSCTFHCWLHSLLHPHVLCFVLWFVFCCQVQNPPQRDCGSIKVYS